MLPWIAAVLLGALAPALIVASLSFGIAVLPFAFAVTLGHSVFLALPLALIYRAKRWTRLGAVVVGGFLIGATPMAVVTWPLSLSARTTASIDGVPTIVNGVPTAAGWLSYLEPLALFGALGAVGGFVFWSTFRWTGLLIAPDLRPTPSLTNSRSGVWLAGAAVTASIIVGAIPSITKDRSCHNLFRDGRTSAVPKVRIDLDAGMDDWPRLTDLTQKFGTAHGMRFRNSNETRSDIKILSLNACTEAGLVITVDEQRWAARKYAPPITARGIPIGIFDLNDGDGWRQLAQDLVTVLESEWPGKLGFRDGKGLIVSRSTAFSPRSNSQ
jgi:hypothetical protein